MNCITTDNLNISYGSLDIVKNLNLNIPKGKITTIIGANGCGKSTVLKTIARILTPKSGEIYINEKEVSKFGSQGQKRTALLTLKLANFELLKELKDEIPILLLDDIMSELDSKRINFLLKYISKSSL